jgi:hypothetical protein
MMCWLREVRRHGWELAVGIPAALMAAAGTWPGGLRVLGATAVVAVAAAISGAIGVAGLWEEAEVSAGRAARLKVWLRRILVALFVCSLIAGAASLRALYLPHAFGDSAPWPNWSTLVVTGWLAFCYTVLIGAHLRFPVPGAVLGILVPPALFVLEARVEAVSQIACLGGFRDSEFVTPFAAVSGILMLSASCAWFLTRAAGRSRVRGGVFVVAVGVLAPAAAVLAVTHTLLRISPQSAEFAYEIVAPNGDALVGFAYDRDPDRSEIWAITTNRGVLRRLTEPLVNHYVFSPDGKEIAYLSNSGFLGLPKRRADLRIVSLNGGKPRTVLTGAVEGWRMAECDLMPPQVRYSPGQRSIALYWEGSLLIVGLDSNLRREFRPMEEFTGEKSMLSWDPSGREILFHQSDPPRFFALDHATGGTRVLPTSAAPVSIHRGFLPGVARRILYSTDIDGKDLYLLDLQDFRTETIATKGVAGFELTDDHAKAVYWIERGGQVPEYDLHIRDLASGNEQVYPRRPVRYSSTLSPDRRFLFDGRTIQSLESGRTVQVDEGLGTIGWCDSGLAVEQYRGARRSRYFLIDPNSGQRTLLWPKAKGN